MTTPDGTVLSGAYFALVNVEHSHVVDAVVFFHGDCGDFYGSLYLGLGRRIAEKSIAFLTANRRDHDHVASGARGGPVASYAFESVDDSRSDFGAWLELLCERGHRHIAIGGAVRATYAQAKERFDNVVAVMAVSPAEYHHEGVIVLHGEDFSGPFRESERNVSEGRSEVLLRPGVPWGSTWSAGAYVDCFNRYSVTTHATNTGCPTLSIFGEEECAVGGPQEIPMCGAARRSLAAAGHPHVQVRERRLEGPIMATWDARESCLRLCSHGWMGFRFL